MLCKGRYEILSIILTSNKTDEFLSELGRNNKKWFGR